VQHAPGNIGQPEIAPAGIDRKKPAASSALRARFYLFLVGNSRSDPGGSKPYIRMITNPLGPLIAECVFFFAPRSLSHYDIPMRIILLTALLAASLIAQTSNGRIAGTVTDASGAPLPNATITVRQVETNTSVKVHTSAGGVYDAPLLLPGTYELTVEATGLATEIARNIRLEVSSALTVDFHLNVATVATSVEVTAEAPTLQTESSGVGATIETRVIEDFPLIERDIMSLVRLIPGVIANPTVGQGRGSRNVFDSAFSVAGGRSSTNEVLLDGSVNTIGDFNGVVISPPQDSVQEFRVETSSYSAEFGRSGGGTVNIITKAGTNQYHGTAYYYHQNDAFNANSFTNNRNGIARPFLRRHQYGYSLGGPVTIPRLYKGENRTFFFSSFEGRRETNPIDQLTSVPTAEQISGDFSRTVALVNGQYQPVRIFDPSTSRVVGGVRMRDPFPGNVIPPNRINAVAKAALGYYPAPNLPGSSLTGLFNYQYHSGKKYSHDLISNRVDQYINTKQRLFVRFNLQENLDLSPTKVVRFVDSTSTWDHFYNYALDHTWQMRTNLNNVFRYSYTRFTANLISNTLGFDPTTLGLPAYFRESSNVLIFPNFAISGPFPTLGGTAYNKQPRDTQGVQDNVVWIKGRHGIKAGAEYRLYRFYPFQVFNPTGGFSFGPGFTQSDQLGAGSPTQGYGLASLLLGTGGFSFDHVEALTAFHHYAGGYLQDDWKAAKRLTLNLGLRWDVETGTAESHNRLSYFDPNVTNPAGGKGAVEFTGNGNPRTIRATNWTNLGPRIGFAYRPFGDKFVVRGGYGIFYLPLGLEPGLTTTPFNYTLTADNLNSDYSPKVTLSDPFPGGLPKPGTANPLSDGSYRLGSNVNIVLRDQPPGYMQEWNVAVSRQLTRTAIVTLTYTGSRGVHLPIPSEELNQINPAALANGGSYLTQLVPNPYFGKFSSGLLAQPMIPREQLLKPFPTFAGASSADAFGGSLNYSRPPVGDSIYHAATVKFERRFSGGLSLDAHYTWSKLLDVGGVGNGAAFTDPSALRDIYNTRLERSLGSFDVPHRLVVIYALDLPFGKNRMFGKALLKGPKWADRALSGWQLTGFHQFQSGLPVSVGGPDLSRIAGASPSRASVVPGVADSFPYATSVANARAYNPNCGCTGPWFNPLAFTTTPQFTIPNGPRFLPDVRQGRPRSWDLTMTKNVRITERLRLGLQGKVYNILNQVTFAGPSVTTVNGNNFGSAGGVSSNPRTLEVGGKLSF
jgi:hypothetical protein